MRSCVWSSDVCSSDLQAGIGCGRGRKPQIGDDVPDFLALIESHAANDRVGDAPPQHDLLKHTGLRVGAVEDDEIAVLEPLTPTLPPEGREHGLDRKSAV